MSDRRRAGGGARNPRSLALGALLAIAIATLAGLVVLWPGDAEPRLAEGLTAPTESAEVSGVDAAPCPPPQSGDCATATVRLETGPDAGEEVQLALGSGSLVPEVTPGDGIRVNRAETQPAPDGVGSAGAGASAAYSFADFERGAPMLWLALAFAAAVILLGRLRGALSLLGLVVSLGIVLFFVVPAILDGSSPVLVALVGGLAVMLITIPMAHGLGPKSIAAMLGTTASLLLVVGLAVAFTDLAHLTGVASEEAALIGTDVGAFSFEGLLVAGMVIGALGVLDDVTVSQASAVLALRSANREQGFRETYRRAIAIGRDHVTATVNTLVLAYVGAALPILLLFSSGALGFFDVANTELVATEIVATLVGSIGLIAAVPLTTLLAAVLASGAADSETGGEHGYRADPHGHGPAAAARH